MNFIIKILLSSVAVIVASYLIPGIYVEDFFVAVIIALVLSLLNVTVKPLLIILTIPLTIFTLGFFLLAINAIIILIAGELIPGFVVDGFWWALLFSLVLSLTNSLLTDISKKDREER